MKGSLGLVLGTLCAIVIACSASHKEATMAPAVPPQQRSQEFPRPNGPEADQIEQLSHEIDTQREQMNLPEPAHTNSCANCARNPTEAMAAGQPSECHRSESDTCKQTCTLSDAICGNAKKICDLANQLAGDQWATKKCSDGIDTCNAAKQRCCTCT
jgi:hypothetical protein